MGIGLTDPYIIIAMEENAGRYFGLMQVVGTKGAYQNTILAIFCVVVYTVGSLSLGGPYYFAVAPYTNCPQEQTADCPGFVCSLPAQERQQYLQKEMGQLRTLGNQFGDYHCDQTDIIATAMGMFFVGSIVGYFCTGPLVDNFGRRITFNACLILGLVGNLMVAGASSLPVAEIGLFLMGFGLENAFNLCFYFLAEQFENKKRQVGLVVIQSCFCGGGLATILWFFLFKQWRFIFWVCYFIPLAICTLMALRYLRETPQFLIRRCSIQNAREQLRSIAKLNGREQVFQESENTSQRAIIQLKDQYAAECAASDKICFSFIDLFRYASLRKMSICVGVVSFCVDFLYYAPVMLISEFGFDFYLNGVLINISELATYALTYFFIARIARRRLALSMFAGALLCSFALVFLNGHSLCEHDCWNIGTVLEVCVVFLLRFAVALEFQVFLIYLNELLPTQVAGVGFSYASIIGTLPSVFIPELIAICDRHHFNIMIFFCIAALLGLAASALLPETRGRPPPEQIREFGKAAPVEIQLVEEAIGS